MGRVTTESAQRLARRYPPRRTPGWLWVALAAALATVGAGWLIWAATVGANPAVSARVSSFAVTSDNEIVVDLTVERPDPGVGVRCLVYAQAVSYDRVGELPVEVAPGGEPLTDVRVTIRTIKRATTAAVESCRAIR